MSRNTLCGLEADDFEAQLRGQWEDRERLRDYYAREQAAQALSAADDEDCGPVYTVYLNGLPIHDSLDAIASRNTWLSNPGSRYYKDGMLVRDDDR